MKIGPVLSVVSNVVLTVCAVVVTALVVRHDLGLRWGIRTPAVVRQVADWRSYAAAGHRSGPETAPVQIVLFSDFQCPACRSLAASLNALRAERPGQFTVVHRHAPLRSHPFAMAAAVASECAAQQGRFDAFHDALFEGQNSIGFAPWSRFAQTAGVPDVPAFDRCVASPGPLADAVARDTLEAHRLQVSATPTFIVNGQLYRGAPPIDTLRAVLDRAAAGPASTGFSRTAAVVKLR